MGEGQDGGETPQGHRHSREGGGSGIEKDTMARGASGRRYAQAVFKIALEQGEPDRWLDDLALLSDAMANEEFANFLDAPQFTLDQKTDLIGESLGDSVSDLARNLISLLASRSSARLLPGITEAYQEMLDAHNGIERAEIVWLFHSAMSSRGASRRRSKASWAGILLRHREWSRRYSAASLRVLATR